MHTKEAKWISDKISALSMKEISPVLNIGSSTKQYREKLQPHINEFILKPLLDRQVKIVNQDIKHDEGVDIVGDLTDHVFLSKLVEVKYKLILCCNLLEHLENRAVFIKALEKMVPDNGYLVITVPFKYPKHTDPIDTMYRPDVCAIAESFSTLRVVDSAMIDIGTVWVSTFPDILKLLKSFLRLLVPFYKYNGWLTTLHKILWLFKKRLITCVLLRKS